jgi:hypothetical protein
VPPAYVAQTLPSVSSSPVAQTLPSVPSSNRHDLVTPATRLTSLFKPTPFRDTPPTQPGIPLSQSDLLVNATGEPRVGPMLQSEIESADRIDVLIAFIRWSGLRLVEPKLREFLEAGKKLRVIITTYTGSNERRAVERLVELGAEVKVSYQTDNTAFTPRPGPSIETAASPPPTSAPPTSPPRSATPGPWTCSSGRGRRPGESAPTRVNRSEPVRLLRLRVVRYSLANPEIQKSRRHSESFGYRPESFSERSLDCEVNGEALQIDEKL